LNGKRALVVGQDNRLTLLGQKLQVEWNREEDLALIQSTQFVELPEPLLLRSHFEPDAEKSLLSNFIGRLSFQWQQLKVRLASSSDTTDVRDRRLLTLIKKAQTSPTLRRCWCATCLGSVN
jgi:hypothetical protein